MKLVLIESTAARENGVTGALNHLGVEVESTDEVGQATARLSGEGLDTAVEESATCCYAVQDKVWVQDPDGAPWEIYTVLGDAPASTGLNGDGMCCASEDGSELVRVGLEASPACC